jgi:beta-lactam-binding protein with PASTA domain
MIIPILLVYMLLKDFKTNQLKSILRMDGIDYNKTYNELSDQEYWEIRKRVIAFWAKYKKIDSTEFTISEKEESIVKEIKSITRSSVKADMSTKAKMAVILCCLFINLLPYPMIKSYVEDQKLLKTELPN